MDVLQKTYFFSVVAYIVLIYYNADKKKNNGHIKHNYENKGNIVYEYAASSYRCVYLYSTYNQLKYIFRYKINTCGRDTNIRMSIQTRIHTYVYALSIVGYVNQACVYDYQNTWIQRKYHAKIVTITKTALTSTTVTALQNLDESWLPFDMIKFLHENSRIFSRI